MVNFQEYPYIPLAGDMQANEKKVISKIEKRQGRIRNYFSKVRRFCFNFTV